VGGSGREIFVLATFSLQFTKAGSTAMLLQLKKNNSADERRSRVNITGFICAVAGSLLDDVPSASSPRMAVAS
jgi:hypothetical protein